MAGYVQCIVGESVGWLCAVYCWGVGWLVMCRVLLGS